MASENGLRPLSATQVYSPSSFLSTPTIWKLNQNLLQSNLVIRNLLVTLKLFLNAKCSLSLWCKLAIGHRKWFRSTNVFLIKPFLIIKFDCTHGLRTPRESFFSKYWNFWAWADKLGRNFMRHLGYFWPNYKHYFGTVSPLSMGKCSWFFFQQKTLVFWSNTYNSQILPK